MDKKSPGVMARIAKQAANMYGECSSIFQQPVLQQHFERSWIGHTQMKSSLYDVESLMQMGRQYNSETKIAQEIATLSVSCCAAWCRTVGRLGVTPQSFKVFNVSVLKCSGTRKCEGLIN